MGLLKRILGLGGDARAATVYAALVEAARVPALFKAMGVGDDIDGRFDMIALVLGLAIDRLDRLGSPGEPLALALTERFVDDMDRNVRELGVGDLSVGKHVKRMAEALEGRRSGYGTALVLADQAALREALVRNLYRGNAPSPSALDAAAAVASGWHDRLAAMTCEDIAAIASPPRLESWLP